MDKIELNRKALHDLYESARSSGACHNVKEFAALIGRNYSSVSAAMNGNPKECNSNLITITNTKLIALGIISKSIVPEGENNDSSMASAMSSITKRLEEHQLDESKHNDDTMMQLLDESRKTNILLKELLAAFKTANNLD